jgi:hypothetical protein
MQFGKIAGAGRLYVINPIFSILGYDSDERLFVEAGQSHFICVHHFILKLP